MAKTKTITAKHTLRERAAQNRALEAEKLRDRMKGIEYLRQIDNDFTKLTMLEKNIHDSKNTADNPFEVENVIAKSKAQADIIKIKLDTNFKRLNKILPDLKSFEHTDPQGGGFESFVNAMIQATKVAN